MGTGCLRRPATNARSFGIGQLSREDFDINFRKRSDHSRLGFALLLCYLRYPGRALGPDEIPPVMLVLRFAGQVRADFVIDPGYRAP